MKPFNFRHLLARLLLALYACLAVPVQALAGTPTARDLYNHSGYDPEGFGIGEIMGGVLLPGGCATVAACPLAAASGTYMIFEGGNQVAAGVPRAWYGTPFNTPFNETLQTFGMSPQAANYTEAVLGWVSTGLAWKSLDAAPAIKTTSSVTGNVVMGGANFANEAKVLEHFEKHGSAFGANTANEYLQVGKDIMQNGQKIEYFYKPAGEMRTGYVQFMGNSSNGTAKFGFVGTNADGAITTIHAESGKSFWNMLNGSPTNKVINLVP